MAWDGQTDGVTALLDLLSPSATQVKTPKTKTNKRSEGLNGHLSIRDPKLKFCLKGSYLRIKRRILEKKPNQQWQRKVLYIPSIQYQSMCCSFVHCARHQFNPPLFVLLSLQLTPHPLYSRSQTYGVIEFFCHQNPSSLPNSKKYSKRVFEIKHYHCISPIWPPPSKKPLPWRSCLTCFTILVELFLVIITTSLIYILAVRKERVLK